MTLRSCRLGDGEWQRKLSNGGRMWPEMGCAVENETVQVLRADEH